MPFFFLQYIFVWLIFHSVWLILPKNRKVTPILRNSILFTLNTVYANLERLTITMIYDFFVATP